MGTESLDLFDTISNIESTGNQVGFLNVPTGVDLYRPKAAGNCSLIILPYVTTSSPYVAAGRMFYMRDYFVFRGLGADQKGRYLDHAKTFKERCAITDSLSQYAGDPAKKPRSQRVALVNAILIEGESRKRVVMDFSYVNFMGALIDDIKTRVEKNPKKYSFLRMFADAKEGVQIDFVWKEESMPNSGNKFFVASAFDYEPHGGVEDQVAHAVDLDKMFAKLNYKQVQNMYLGYDDDSSTPAHEAPAAVVTTKAPVVEPTLAVEPPAPKPKATKKEKAPASELPPTYAAAAEFKKGDPVMFEGRTCKVYKVVADVITLMDEEKDDFIKANVESITRITPEVKPKPELATAAAAKDGDEPWDADWAT